MTALYIHIAKGTSFKPGENATDLHAIKGDYISLPNGDSIGVIIGVSRETRKKLEAVPGITVLPPIHRPLQDHHLAAFKHIKPVKGETTYDIAEKLYDEHKMPWFHPEETNHFF